MPLLLRDVTRHLVGLLLAVAVLPAQTIRITGVPPSGSPGVLDGVVTGVDFATHRVAVYLHIEGSGWWTKPSAAAPTVPIRPDGTFTAGVYSCCLDDRATLFCTALLPPGAQAPLAAGACAVPPLNSLAVDHRERFGRTLQFAGRTWAVKDSPAPVGPGGNLFSADPGDVFVDGQGRLHLRVVARNGRWWCSEVVLLDDFGHGTCWFTTESQVGSLDPNVTFGAFTWDPFCDDTTIPAWPNREIDFEDSRWGNAADPFSSQVVVQPWQVPGNVVRYTTPTLFPSPTLTRYWTWTSQRLEFGVVRGRHAPCAPPPGQVVHRSMYLHDPSAGRRLPPPGRQRFRFNLWINQGSAPRNGQTAEVIVSDFRYGPAGTLVTGCGVNPRGSARVLGGAPVLGATVTLGFDNPLGSQTPGSLLGVVLGLPAAPHPCGLLRPGLGMAGPLGEVLVDPASGPVGLLAGVWAGPGLPVPFALHVPSLPALVGAVFVAQGALLDLVGPLPAALTDGIELCVRL